MKIQENIRKNFYLIIGILIVLFTISVFLYVGQQSEKNKSNKKNSISTITTNNNNITKEKQLKKKEKQNTIIFTSQMHNQLIKKYWKWYVIDFLYGVWYTTKVWSNILYLDPEKKRLRNIQIKKMNTEIEKFCKWKMNIYSFKKEELIKKINTLNTYLKGWLFLYNEKWQLIKKAIKEHCKIYDPLSIKIIQKLTYYVLAGISFEYYNNIQSLINPILQGSIIVSKDKIDKIIKDMKDKGIYGVFKIYFEVKPIERVITEKEYNRYKKEWKKVTKIKSARKQYYIQDNKKVNLFLKY